MSGMINKELVLITEWLQINKLSLNISKTNYMIMSSQGKRYSPENCTICIDDNIIERVNNTKFLGVIIDDKLTWKLHVEYICNKVAKGIGILRRARQIVYAETLQMLYDSLIKPYFTYCIIIWGNTYKTYINKLFILQKKVVRIITNSEFSAHSAPLFRKRNIMNVKELYQYFVGLFVYKSLHNELPASFCELFHRNMNMRMSANLRSVYRKKKICQTSIKIAGPKIWNDFPINVKSSNSLYYFKKCLKFFLSSTI